MAICVQATSKVVNEIPFNLAPLACHLKVPVMDDLFRCEIRIKWIFNIIMLDSFRKFGPADRFLRCGFFGSLGAIVATLVAGAGTLAALPLLVAVPSVIRFLHVTTWESLPPTSNLDVAKPRPMIAASHEFFMNLQEADVRYFSDIVAEFAVLLFYKCLLKWKFYFYVVVCRWNYLWRFFSFNKNKPNLYFNFRMMHALFFSFSWKMPNNIFIRFSMILSNKFIHLIYIKMFFTCIIKCYYSTYFLLPS